MIEAAATAMSHHYEMNRAKVHYYYFLELNLFFTHKCIVVPSVGEGATVPQSCLRPSDQLHRLSLQSSQVFSIPVANGPYHYDVINLKSLPVE